MLMKKSRILLLIVIAVLTWTLILSNRKTSLLQSRTSFCVNSTGINLLELSVKQQTDLYFKVFQDQVEPNNEQMTFGAGQFLEIVLIDLGTNLSPRLLPSIYNIANIYGRSDTGLTVILSSQQFHWIAEKRAFWHSIKFIDIGSGPFSADYYNHMMVSSTFYSIFSSSKYLLVTHTDSMLLEKVREEFFKFDIIGTPWPCFCQNFAFVGGGFSLRNINSMKKIIQSHNYTMDHEELFFQKYSGRLANGREGITFAAEMNNPVDSVVGAHKLYLYDSFKNSGDTLRKFLSKNPTKSEYSCPN
jgi:Protein of unknown function (DUF5672)